VTSSGEIAMKQVGGVLWFAGGVAWYWYLVGGCGFSGMCATFVFVSVAAAAAAAALTMMLCPIPVVCECVKSKCKF